jgi:hypothetical protein
VKPSRIWRGLALLSCALFLASVGRYYHPGFGFTALIGFPAGHDYEIPALRALPHYDYPAHVTYDGQFYAQLALEPLLRDPAIERAMDQPAYRARRILFSWTAYALGFGKPAWVLQVYAVQNVICWLILAWLLARWLPPTSGRMFALWAACMFSQGLLWSVRFALVDGPSLLVLVCAVVAAEKQRTWALASIVGIAGLGRETNLLGASLLRWPRTWKEWLRTAGALVVIALPLLVWQDYLFSIYRRGSLAGGDQIAAPAAAFLRSWNDSTYLVWHHGLRTPAVLSLAVVISLTVQAVFLAWSRAYRNVWWRLALGYAVLMLIVDIVVWEGYPGAITRIVLPMTFGFNVLLAQQRAGFWIWFVSGNLHLIASTRVL